MFLFAAVLFSEYLLMQLSPGWSSCQAAFCGFFQGSWHYVAYLFHGPDDLICGDGASDSC